MNSLGTKAKGMLCAGGTPNKLATHLKIVLTLFKILFKYLFYLYCNQCSGSNKMHFKILIVDYCVFADGFPLLKIREITYPPLQLAKE